MKKSNYNGKMYFSILLIFILFTSCSDNINSDKSNEKKENPVKIKFVTNNSVNKKIKDWENKHLKTGKGSPKFSVNGSNNNSLEFDYDHLRSAKMKEKSTTSIIARQVGFNKENNINFAKGFVENENNQIIHSFVVKSEKISESVKKETYYKSNGDEIVTLLLNKKNKSVKTIKRNGNHESFTNIKSSTPGCDGQEVADCISDTYTNHGWWSVGYWVESAFVPETAVAVAAECTRQSCYDDPQEW